VFSYAIGNLVREFMSRDEGGVFTIVDIGCGGGELIRALREEIDDPRARFFGIDRPRTIDGIPIDGTHFIISNELYDAFPFARLVQRGERLHELWINDQLEWTEREAPASYEDYFAGHGIALDDGQFADVSLEWETFHADVIQRFDHALIVTIDYGHPANKLFHPRARRFGTAAAYAQQRVTRDLLANPGEQDLTAHINFTDLERAGERNGATTLFFDRLAKFLLTLDITSHELFRSAAAQAAALESRAAADAAALLQARESARRLILPDGIGEDQRVLVQAKGVPLDGWSFQKKLF